MAFTYPLSLPSVSPAVASIVLTMRDVIGVGESPFTLSQQIYEHAGKRWEAHVSLRKLTRADAEEWIAFLAELNGRKGTFLMGDPAGAAARGALGGTPLVNGASQTGQVLNIDGCSNSITNWLRKGDYVQLGSGPSTRLHKSVADVNSNGSGQAIISLWPGMRIAPADNDPLVLASALGLWRLATNVRSFSISDAILYGIEFDAVEAL